MRGSHRSGALRWIAPFTAPMIVLLAAVSFLPHNRYLRFSSLHASSVMKSSWIYERIHFDPTPTDIVLIGSSHTVFGVDSARVEEHYRSVSGHDLHVVNFGLQHLGRDLQYVLAREVLRTRPVKLLVIEVQEGESRSLHPAFGSLADAADVIDAPALINTGYLSNLAQLPTRQLRLFIHSLLPGVFGEHSRFDAGSYAGAHWDDTYSEHSIPGQSEPFTPRLGSHTPYEMEQQRARANRIAAGKLALPGPLKPLETRANLLYLKWTLEAAEQAHVPVRFLYMPNFATAALPEFRDVYAARGPIWFPQDVYQHPDWWLDLGHLNHAGAQALSDWLGAALAREQPQNTARLDEPDAKHNIVFTSK